MASGLKIAKAIVAGGMTAMPIAVQQTPLVQGVRDEDTQLLDEQDANEDEDVPLIDEPKGEKWDYATTTSRKDKPRKTGKFIEYLKKLFKLFSYVVFGGMVFAGATISKACLMILANGAKNYTSPNPDSPTKFDCQHDVVRAWCYIIILVMLLFPELLTIVYSIYKLIMRKEKMCDKTTLLCGAFLEFIDAVGHSILVVKVLPYLDSTFAFLIMPLVGVVPSFLSFSGNILTSASITNQSKRFQNRKYLTSSGISTILQVGGLVSVFACLSSNEFSFLKESNTYVWTFVGILLSSVRFWENFVYIESFHTPMKNLRNKLDDHRFSTSFIFSLMKCLVIAGMTFLILGVVEKTTFSTYNKGEENFITALLTGQCGKSPPKITKESKIIIEHLWYVFLTQAGCSTLAFFFGRLSCMTMIQPGSFTFPLILVTPVLTAVSAALCVRKQLYAKEKQCVGLLFFAGLDYLDKSHHCENSLSYYLDWNNAEFKNETVIILSLVGLLLGWAGMVLLTLYLWRHTEKTRLKRMEILFVKAIYSGVLIDQILLLNRRKDEKEFMQRERLQNRTADSRRIRCQRNDLAQSNHRSASFVPQIFLCATMWHETEQEMTQMLTSIMRLDKDQVTLKANRQTREEDYYNFEVHIMFDDAMTYTDGCTPEINNWVRMFCKLIPVAAKKAIEELDDNFDSFPIIYATPYGGKIVFTLPCFQNKLVVHLKDKEKIRHRKRWSQCMYMYYILGYRCTTENWNLDEIFLLALDGDVDFQPEAVSLLVDRMKKNNDVGAACGRIHPIGSGPVVWFQKFEYAVGHWLQKTAEHVLGCVFCSPGCFSMFRGQALVDENVMKTYTTPPSKDIHYIQWDQGEDRWLCTLLLKQGWKIEYCAASDSYTFAPEDFKEFYNQRRRWSPSTMANVLDVLRNASLVVEKNQYVSWGYIIYQIALMVASLLGPATVIMVVQGAYQYVFNWSLTLSLLVSLVPVVFFVIICYTVSADVQVVIAEILTIIYALVMMAVIVGVIGSMASGIILDPNNLFMLLLLAIYGLTGLLHPQEMMCLVHGILYYLCVPSAFIFLMIYSLTNMDNVSWGTREVKSYSQPEAKPENNPESNKNSKATDTKSSNTTEDSHKCKIGNICECYCCIKPKDDDSRPAPTTQQNLTTPVESQPTSAALGSNSQLQSISNMSNAELFKTARELEIDSDHLSLSQLRKILEDKHQNKDVKNQPDAEVANEIESVQLIKETCVDENGNKFSWLRVGALEFAEEKSIDNNERLFWQKLIKKYLEPLKENKNKKQEIAGNLKDLRNRMSAAYIMINALWLVLNFALQLSITDVAIVFYIGSTKNTVNPIQFAFLVFFFIILLIQFTCMLLHRWSTGVHLLSKTKLYTGNEKEITIPTTARHTHEGIPTTASPTTTHARYYNPTFENDLDIACCTEDIAGPSNQQHQENPNSSILTEEVSSQNARKPPRRLNRSHTTPHFYHDNDENGKSPKSLWGKLRKHTLGRRNKIEQDDSDKSIQSAWTHEEITPSASKAPDISIPPKHVQLSKISGRGRVIDFLGSDESKRTAMWLTRRGIKVRRTIRSTQVGSSCGYIAVYAAWAIHKAAKRGEDWATCKIKDPSYSKDWIENQNQILSLEYLDRDFSEQLDVAKPLLNKEILFLLHHYHDLEYSDEKVPMTWFHGTLSSNIFREGVQDHIKNFQLESEFTGSSKLRIAIVNSTNSAQGQHWFTVAYQLHK